MCIRSLRWTRPNGTITQVKISLHSYGLRIINIGQQDPISQQGNIIRPLFFILLSDY